MPRSMQLTPARYSRSPSEPFQEHAAAHAPPRAWPGLGLRPRDAGDPARCDAGARQQPTDAVG